MTSALPFTPAAFFELFADYNERLWPIVVAIWLAALALAWASWRDPIRYNRALTALLAALWAWNAIVYHGWLFTRINPAAWLFAGLFALEAGLLAAAAGQGLSFFASGGRAPRAGLLLAAYAFAYPLLTVASGHRYPAVPTFAVPCPTVILTIGLFLTVPAVPRRLEAVPVMWGAIGGSAAILLDVPTDYVLLGAGLMLAAVGLRPYLRHTTRSSPE